MTTDEICMRLLLQGKAYKYGEKYFLVKVSHDKSYSRKERQIAKTILAMDGIRLSDFESDGGPGSGNFGHKGRPGQVGGSGEGGGSGASSSGGSTRNTGLERTISSMLHPTSGSANEAWAEHERSNKELKRVVSSTPVGAGYKIGPDFTITKTGNGKWEYKYQDGTGEYDDKGAEHALVTAYRAFGEQIENIGGEGKPAVGNITRQTGTSPNTPEMVNGRVMVNLGTMGNGEKLNDSDYSLTYRGMTSPDGKKEWTSSGKPTKQFPRGTGTTVISESDIGTGLHSVSRYVDKDGHLTPERAAVHDRAIEKLFAGKKPVQEGQQKVFTFLGGGAASGKGNFTRPKSEDETGYRNADFYGIPDNVVQATIDPDEFKKDIPEYDVVSGMLDRDKAASFAHEESSALGKRAMALAFENGYNCTYDGTGDGSYDSVMGKIIQARNAHYKVDAVYCTRDIDNAIEAALARAKKQKRYVDPETVANIHRKVSVILPQVVSEFDHCRLYDHDGEKPRLIMECRRGEKPVIYDQDLYKKFLDKANYVYKK